MQKVKVNFNDENTPKKFSAFLEKLIAQTLFELYSADQYTFTSKVDNPYE